MGGHPLSADAIRTYQMSLLKTPPLDHKLQELSTTPIFPAVVLESDASSSAFPQYGIIAGILANHTVTSADEKTYFGFEMLSLSDRATNDIDSGISETTSGSSSSSLSGSLAEARIPDPRLFYNVSAPSSVFICGSQGSGKSHTLSCLLENCLISSKAGKLSKPLSGVVFHWDTFVSDRSQACEVAHLSSNPKIEVRVLCSPTNIWAMKQTYAPFKSISVSALQLDQSDLNTKRMMDLMAVNVENGIMPLYLHSVTRILREMRTAQRGASDTFNYGEFKRLVAELDLSLMQRVPLEQKA